MNDAFAYFGNVLVKPACGSGRFVDLQPGAEFPVYEWFGCILPGIVGGILLAVSRAIGETMIVVMAAGLSANLTANPLEAVTTVTVQIVTLLTGDQEFDSPKTLAAFALGLVLFIVTLVLNVIALHVVRKYREQYE